MLTRWGRLRSMMWGRADPLPMTKLDGKAASTPVDQAKAIIPHAVQSPDPTWDDAFYWYAMIGCSWN